MTKIVPPRGFGGVVDPGTHLPRRWVGGAHCDVETTSKIEIQTGQGLMPAYCAVPSTPPPWPGVVVIHDFTGMSHDLRRQADWLAGEGFLAVAPDLYYWGGRLSCLRTIMRDIGQRRSR